jgi:hypothetical protein
MSTILKALRRLEAEQTGATKSAPPPETPRPKPDRPRGRSLWLALAIGGALGFGGAALWTFFGPSSAPESGPALASNPTPVPPPARRAPKPTPVPRAADPAIEFEAPPAEMPAMRPIAPKSAAKPAASPVPRPPTSQPAARQPVAQQPAVEEPARRRRAVRDTPVREAATPRAAPASAPQPAPAAAPTPVAKAAVDPAPPAPPPSEEPSPVERPAIPHVVVAQTQWHPDQALRRASVELEGRDTPLLLRIGDAVGPLIVTRIDPSGVVFRMGDVEIRRRVGER